MRYINLPLHELLDASEICDVIDENLPCSSLRALLRNNGRTTSLSYEFQMILIGNGLCFRVFNEIMNKNYHFKHLIEEYAKEHPLFENNEEKLESKRKMDNLIMPGEISWSEEDIDYSIVYKLMCLYVSKKKASTIAYHYAMGDVYNKDIAKFVILCVDPPVEDKKVDLTDIEPISSEKGFDINVEGLL